MSASMLCDLDMVVIFGKYRCVVIMEADHSKVFEGFRRGDLYIVDFSTGPQPAVCLLSKASEGWLWHRRLGHAGMRNLRECASSSCQHALASDDRASTLKLLQVDTRLVVVL